jgi:hypothetical protein
MPIWGLIAGVIHIDKLDAGLVHLFFENHLEGEPPGEAIGIVDNDRLNRARAHELPQGRQQPTVQDLPRKVFREYIGVGHGVPLL